MPFTFNSSALSRGPQGESAQGVLEKITEANRYRFDQACRVKAIKIAAQLKMSTMLSINFLPNAIYRPEVCIRIIAEGIETLDEYQFLQDLGINLMQGFLFSKPLFEASGQLEKLYWPQK